MCTNVLSNAKKVLWPPIRVKKIKTTDVNGTARLFSIFCTFTGCQPDDRLSGKQMNLRDKCTRTWGEFHSHPDAHRHASVMDDMQRRHLLVLLS